ncbi:hypothetical protein C7S10_20965 [Nocardioides currus]|uniref:Uncharacterized protein n=1 Tax=Nocardioides currus TaxID=2133958 RepID=A0A2R7YS07_9ACTN|nr:hypothetical protein C7S10_20965 [Nocardioides currus]
MIGGAVGAAGTLAGSVLTQVLGQRAARQDRAGQRTIEVQDRWFDERRELYLELLGFGRAACNLAGELGHSVRLDDTRRTEIAKELRQLHTHFFGRESRVALLGSDAMYSRMIEFSSQILLMENAVDAADRGVARQVAHTAREVYSMLTQVARDDLGIGPLKPPIEGKRLRLP